MIFDTHIHLNDIEYANELDSIINNALNKGIKYFLCVGYDLNSSKRAIEIAEKYDCVFASVGIIPTERKQYDNNSINKLRKMALQSKKVIAIGEIGLDYYWEKTEEIKGIQKKMFIEQIHLANELNLPLSIHVREAYEDSLKILKENRVANSGIMHCYSGSLEMAKEYIKLGFKIAFGGVLTFKNAKIIKNVLLNIRPEDIVFETDAPYLSPVPYRGKRNLPEYIINTVECAADLLHISIEELEKTTFRNSLKSLHVETYENKN